MATIHFEDQDFEFDIDDIDVNQARAIKRYTQMSLFKWQEALKEADPDALVGLYWLMMNQNGKAVDMHKVNFKIVQFGNAVGEAFEREAEENPTEEPAETSATT